MNGVKSSDFFNPSARTNLLMDIFYRLSWPMVPLFARWGISPNQVTTLSLVFTVLSFGAMFVNYWAFAFLWIFAELLDMADGTLARFTKASSALGAFYDHTSDKVKLFAFLFLVAYLYFSPWMAVAAGAACASFALLVTMNAELSLAEMKLKAKKEASAPQPALVASAVISQPSFWRRAWHSLVLVDGSTILLLVVAPSHPWAAMASLVYFGLICLRGTLLICRQRIRVDLELARMPKS